MPNEGARGSVHLAVALAGGGSLLLCLDDPREAREIPGDAAAAAADLPAGSFLIVDGAEPRVDSVGDVRLVPRGLLWSLLAPMRADAGDPLRADDHLDAERTLRREGQCFWEGLAVWRDLDPALPAECRSLLAPFGKGLAALWDRLAALAAGGAANPFATWDAAAEPDVATPAGDLPAPPEPDADAVASWLGDAGNLAAVLGPEATPRFEQSAMARDVAGALAAGSPLLVEAGTGVGKTLAYLLPLLSRLAGGGCRAVVSTFTRTLQNQILDHDLPLLARIYPELRVRLLMGRQNYLCRRSEVRFLGRPVEDAADAWAAVSFRLWRARTTSGMREEIQRHPCLRAHLAELFDSHEPCSPSLCHGRSECFVQKARRLAREADLVIVNHSLLMNDFAARRALIGGYELLVVDEAHRMPQVALDTFSIRCDRVRLAVIEDLIGEVRVGGPPPDHLAALGRTLAGAGETAAKAAERLAPLAQAVAGLFTAYRRWLAALGGIFDERVAEGAGVRPPGRVRVYSKDETFAPLRPSTLACLEAASNAAAAYAAFAGALEMVPTLPEGLDDDLATVARAAELLGAIEDDVRFLTQIEDDEWVTWLEPDPRAGLRAVGATRLEAGGLLREHWLACDLAPVLTSATLGVGEDFSHMSAELGVSRLSRPLITSLIASPFDWETQARIVAMPSMPAPDRPGYLDEVVRLLTALTNAVPRKTLVLFTAYQTLQQVARELKEAAPPPEGELFDRGGDRPWLRTPPVILAQGGEASPAELIDRFRRERHAVLLGTNTFWEGVDFPGHELEILVVTKLPFQVPTDPWVEARCDRLQNLGEDPFGSFMVRDAVLRLRQGIGRLIRSGDDRGVVLLLDSRLHGKSYGITFLNALPTRAHYCTDVPDVVARVAEFFSATP